MSLNKSLSSTYCIYLRNLIWTGCAAALFATPVFAQDTTSPEKKNSDAVNAKNLQGVTVTGSRISNPNIVSPTPISVISAADIKATGAVNIGDFLTTQPQLATTFTMGNSTQYIGTAGVQELDLRNLGPARTLVLVNGRRFVGSSAGDSGVDVNDIPVDFIDRVEIITGGASAVYGADAVSGVVNFILKKNYTGANLNVQYGGTQHGDFNKRHVSLSGGMSFAQDRGNIAVSAEHSDQDSLNFRDIYGHQAYGTILTPGGATDKALFSNAGGYTTTNGGTFALNDGSRYVFDPNGSVRPQNLGTFHDNRVCQDCDRLDANQVQQLQPEYGRTTLSAIGSFNITPEQRLYAEGSYTHVDTKSFGQPSFGTYTIGRDNAYISPQLGALMDANGAQSIDISRFDVDGGLRGEDTGRNISRLVLGANGIITGDWEYDGSVTYGRSEETRHELNDRIVDRFNASIDAVRDGAGNIVCRSTLDPNSVNPNSGGVLNPIALGGGCVPTSVFGQGAINPQAAAYYNQTGVVRSTVTQFVGGGSITNNNLFQMPFDAGAASLAAGVEFRRETSRQLTDPLDAAGLTFANAIPNSSGAYDVKEGYIETALPLLTGQSFVKSLTIDGAARFSDYSNFGHTKTWRWGLDWAVDDNISFRGTMSSAVRVPNIGELYSGQVQNFAFVTDPCSVSERNNGANAAVRAANCAALGVPANFQSNASATVSGISGSNPNLKPEQGRTYTAGLVFTPQFIDGFGLTADYFNIKLTNAISQLDFQTTAEHCVDSTTGIDNVYCNNVTRSPPPGTATAPAYEISNVVAINQNLSELDTSGVDFGAYYSHDLGTGKIKFRLDATKTIAYTEHPFQDDPTNLVQDRGTLGFPKWKSVLSTTYNWNSWVFNWNARYFSPMLRVTNESYKANPTQTTPIRAASGFFNDLRASYEIKNSGVQMYAGINNVLDRSPPVNLFGTTFGSALYDALGREYYVGFNYKF